MDKYPSTGLVSPPLSPENCPLHATSLLWAFESYVRLPAVKLTNFTYLAEYTYADSRNSKTSSITPFFTDSLFWGVFGFYRGITQTRVSKKGVGKTDVE